MEHNKIRNENLSIFTLSYTMMTGMWGPALLFSILPLLQEKLNISSVQAGLLISIFIISASSFMLLGGMLGDRYGRKKIIIIGTAIYGFAGLLGFVFTEITQLYIPVLIIRVIQGLSNGLYIPNTVALTGDLFRGSLRTKAMGFLESFNSFGGVVAPFIAALVTYISWNSTFLVYPVASAISILCIHFFIPDPDKKEEEKDKNNRLPLKTAIKKIKGSKSMMGVFITGFVTFFIFMGLQSFIAIYAKQKFSIGILESGLVVPLPALGMSIASIFVGQYGARFTPLKRVSTGFFIIILSILSLPFAPKWVFYFLLFVSGLGCGIIVPTLSKILADLTSRNERGFIYSIYILFRALGSAVGPVFFTSLLILGLKMPFLTGGLVVFIIYFFSRNLLKEKMKVKTEAE